MLNTTMLLFLFLSSLERYGVNLELKQWMIQISVGWIFFMIFFGWFEDKLGFYKAEKGTMESRSPALTEIIKKLNNIEDMLKNDKRKSD